MANQKKDTTLYGSFFPTKLYGVQDFNSVLEGIISDGVIVPYVTEVIINFDLRVTLGLSKALGIKSRITTGETIDFTIDTAHATLDRVDAIFYRVDLSSDKRDSIIYKPGFAGIPTPPDPDLSNPTLIKELRLCNINVNGGVSSIVPSNIDETVQEASTVQVLADLATNAVNDEDGNKIKDFYAKDADNKIYTYDRLGQLGLLDAAFGTDLIDSIGKIITALQVKNPVGGARYQSIITTLTHPNLVIDINDALGLAEARYNLSVYKTKNEQTDTTPLGNPSEVNIIRSSNGEKWIGTFSTDLTPNLTMKNLVDNNMQSYDSFDQLGLVDSSFSAVDWDSNIEKIIDELISLSPNASAVLSLYFTGSGVSEFSNLLASLNAELSLSTDGYTLKVETLFSEADGVASLSAPTKVSVVENITNDAYIGYYDSGNFPHWQGFLFFRTKIGPSLIPGTNITITLERIEKFGRMVVLTANASFGSGITINDGDTIFTINDDDFRPLIDVAVNIRTGGEGTVDAYLTASGGILRYDGPTSVTGSDAFRITASYIAKQ